MTLGLGPPFVADETWVPREEWPAIVLTAALNAAVPAEMPRMADWTPEQRVSYARNRWAVVRDSLSGGAELLMGGKHCAAEFAVLAGVLAALAYQPGGVTFAGMHWCTDHDVCEKAAIEAEERANA